MKAKTIRVPEGLQDAVQDLSSAEHIEEAAAMRKLMYLGYEAFLATQYRHGHLSLRDVAERLDVSLSEALERLQALGVSGNTGADDTLASLRSLQSRPRP
ncbi:MAG: hypothetical protein LC641_06050 [Spirochaeta sp.]|nr:hypothetical protein [Spirochaeta sp.]